MGRRQLIVAREQQAVRAKDKRGIAPLIADAMLHANDHRNAVLAGRGLNSREGRLAMARAGTRPDRRSWRGPGQSSLPSP